MTSFNSIKWDGEESTLARRRRQYNWCRRKITGLSLDNRQGFIWVIRFEDREQALPFALHLFGMNQSVYMSPNAGRGQRPNDIMVTQVMHPTATNLSTYRRLLITDVSDFAGQIVVDGDTFDWTDPSVRISDGYGCFIAARSFETCAAMAQHVLETGGGVAFWRKSSRIWPWYVVIDDFDSVAGLTPIQADTVMRRFSEQFSGKFMFISWHPDYVDGNNKSSQP